LKSLDRRSRDKSLRSSEVQGTNERIGEEEDVKSANLGAAHDHGEGFGDGFGDFGAGLLRDSISVVVL
jgi:hypothetical protein